MYAPLATDEEIRQAMNTDVEPWHHPHFAHSQAPITAEASTEVGADEPEDPPLTDAEALQMLGVYVLSAVAAVACVAALINAAGLLL